MLSGFVSWSYPVSEGIGGGHSRYMQRLGLHLPVCSGMQVTTLPVDKTVGCISSLATQKNYLTL